MDQSLTFTLYFHFLALQPVCRSHSPSVCFFDPQEPQLHTTLEHKEKKKLMNPSFEVLNPDTFLNSVFYSFFFKGCKTKKYFFPIKPLYLKRGQCLQMKFWNISSSHAITHHSYLLRQQSFFAFSCRTVTKIATSVGLKLNENIQNISKARCNMGSKLNEQKQQVVQHTSLWADIYLNLMIHNWTLLCNPGNSNQCTPCPNHKLVSSTNLGMIKTYDNERQICKLSTSSIP